MLVRDDGNVPVGILEINRDLSARKRSEDALVQSEAQFRTLANAIPQLCWMANADGWIFWYNERWYRVHRHDAGRDGRLGLAIGARPRGAAGSP